MKVKAKAKADVEDEGKEGVPARDESESHFYRTDGFRQPFSWKAGVIFIFTGGCMIVYFRHEKARMERRRIAEATKGVGRPKVGGEFHLIDQNGRPFSSDDMKGKYSLVREGFSA